MGAAAVFERGDAIDPLSNAAVGSKTSFLSRDAV